MAISGKRMYSMLEKLGFVRLSTFDGEKKGAEIISAELKAITGNEPTREQLMAPR